MKKVSKPILYHERLAIESGLKKGWSYQTIATDIDRSKNGIRMEVVNNGGPELYNAEEAEKRMMKVREEKKLTVSKTLIGKAKDFSIRERLI